MEYSGKTVELYELGLNRTGDGAIVTHPTGNRAVFRLGSDEPDGQGSSCAVYSARRTDGAGGPVRLKRCLSREEEDEARFLNTVRLQYTLLEEVNGIAHILGLYRGEDGNLWSLHSYEHGMSYDRMGEESLWRLLRNGRFIAQAVRRTHLQGYLHLDISPGNIFFHTPGSGMEGVAIVDCDSFVPAERLFEPGISLYTSAEYGAPEVGDESRERIGPASDVYSLGVVLFEKLFDRLPSRREGGCCAPIPLEESRMFDQMTVKTRLALEDFFNRTICISPAARLPDMDAVLERLEELIALTDPNNARQPKLCKKEIRPTQEAACFVPRNDEVRQIRDAFLGGAKAVAVIGFGGTGKTEVARQFAHDFSDEFDGIDLAVIRTPDSESAILDGLNVLNCSVAGETQNCIRQLDEQNLIILDNFDHDSPECLQALREFLEHSGKARVIITTQMERVASLPGVVAVRIESSKELSLELFRRICDRPMNGEEQEDLLAILKGVGYHTYATDLIARELAAYPELSPAQFRQRCKENGVLGGSEGTEVVSSKDGLYSVDSMAGHIKRLFANVLTHNFSPAERSLMVFLTRSPAEYFDASVLCRLIGDHAGHMQARTALNRLLGRNRLQQEWLGERQMVSVQSLMAESLLGSGVICRTKIDTTLFLRNLCTIVDIPDFDRFYYGICDYHFPMEFPFAPDNAFPFFDRLNRVIKLRRDRYVVSQQEGVLAFGMSETQQETEYWIYLEKHNVTVSWLRLVRGYAITPEDLLPQRLELREKVGRTNERSYLHVVQRNTGDGTCFDLEAMSARPCAEGDIDLSDLFPKKLTPRFSVAKGPFRGGFTPLHLDVIGQMAFRYAADWLQSAVIPKGVVALEELAFAGCRKLKQVTFPSPNTVRHIGHEAFAFTGLEEVVLPGGIESIGMGAFSVCRKLHRAVLPEGLKTISTRLFSLDLNLQQVIIPPSVKTIGAYAFSRCPCEDSIPRDLGWSPDPRSVWDLKFEDQLMGNVPVWRADGSYQLYREVRKKTLPRTEN